MKIQKTGNGEFGSIFIGIKGEEAVNFLILQGEGEVKDALYHPKIGSIDLIWGKSGEKGFGLAKIIEKHPEAIKNLSESISKGKIVEEFQDRIIMINEENNQRSIMDLQFNNKLKTWVVTSYIPI